MSLTSQQVIDALNDPKLVFSNDEINRMWKILKVRHSQNQALQVHSFAVGQKVQFSTRYGAKTGTVRKINQKSVQVSVEEPSIGGVGRAVQWKVAPSLLTVVQ